MSAQTYTATAEREGRRGWVVTVPDVGVTQARSLAHAESMAADMISAMEDVPVADVRVTVEPVLPADIRAALDVVRESERHAKLAREQKHDVIRKLRASGMGVHDTARMLGVTTGRVSQIAPLSRKPRDRQESAA